MWGGRVLFVWGSWYYVWYYVYTGLICVLLFDRSEAKRFFGARRNDARRNDGRCVLKIENGEQSKIWVTGHPKIGQFSVPKTPLQMAIFLADKWKKTSRNRATRRQKKDVLGRNLRSGRSAGRSAGRPAGPHPINCRFNVSKRLPTLSIAHISYSALSLKGRG